MNTRIKLLTTARCLMAFLALGGPLTVTISAADPLDHWTHRNPLPTGNGLNGVAFGNGRYVAVGELGTIVTSTNGVAWEIQSSGAQADLKDIAWGNGQFVAVSDADVFLVSSDAVDWTAAAPGLGSARNRHVAFGHGLFVTVAERVDTPGPVTSVSTSVDGWSWTPPTEIPQRLLRGIAATGTGFVAVGEAGAILTSPDGQQWTPWDSHTGQALLAVASGTDRIVALGAGESVALSADGTAWNVASSGASEWVYGAAFSASGTFAAVGAGGKILTSTTGVSWASRTTGKQDTLRDVVVGDNGFVAVGDRGAINTSPTGTAWTRRTRGTSEWLYDVAFGNGRFVAVGGYYTVPGFGTLKTILTSTNGVDWVPRTASASPELFAITYGGGLFIATGGSYEAAYPGYILSSPDGIGWTTRSSTSKNWLWGVTYGNGTFVALGENYLNFDEGYVLTSTNGITWTQRRCGTIQELSGGCYGNDRFVLVGCHGAVITSADAVSWSSQNSGTTEYLRDAAYGAGLFVAVGELGTILTSPDGTNWTARASGTIQSLYDVIYAAGRFLITGCGGTLLTSPDGVSWTAHTSGTRERLQAAAYGNDAFVLVGDYGAILQSDPVTTGLRTPGGLVTAPGLSGEQTVPGADDVIESESTGAFKPLRVTDDPPPGGDTNVHHFSVIRARAAEGVQLELASRTPTGFGSYYDIFPIETSTDLKTWLPWLWLVRTNRSTYLPMVVDPAGLQPGFGFYRTPTNHLPTVVPQPTGPYFVGRVIRELRHTAHPVRNAFMVSVYYPAEPPAGALPARYLEAKLVNDYSAAVGGSATVYGGSYTFSVADASISTREQTYPVVLYSPGSSDVRTENQDKCEELASHGFVVISMDHADTVYSLYADQSLYACTHDLPFASMFYVTRLRDAQFVLDEVERWQVADPKFSGRLDTNRMAMFGFSAGGGVSLEMARIESRCRAALLLDPGAPSDLYRPGFDKPVLILAGGDGDAMMSVFRNASRAFFDQQLTHDAWWMRVRSATYLAFGEWHWFKSPTTDYDTRVGLFTRRCVASFFKKYLRGEDDHFLDAAPAEYPMVDVFLKK